MGQKLIDEVGQRFGALQVLSLTKDKNNRTAWLCKCDCGNTKIVRGSDLRTGKITTCGQKGCPCKSLRSAVKIDRTNQRYGKLVALYENGRSKSGKIIWHCKCDCGNECDVIGSDLASGMTQSCGCLKSIGELNIAQWLQKKNINFKKEFSFKDLYITGPGYPLRFDFAIFNKNNILIGLIEYQGEQHYYPVQKFGGYEEYSKRMQSDALKKDYCIKNNIPLCIIRGINNINSNLTQFLKEI